MMLLTPWSPKNGGPLPSFQQGMDEWTRRIFGWPLQDGVRVPAWAPRVDVEETDKEVVVKADLPGVDPKDLDVSVLEGALILHGLKKEEKEEKAKNFHRVERFRGDFYRELPLPAGADPDKIAATCTQGVVTVTIPKKPAAQPMKIAVKPE
jgi:HSP20 family protein